MQELQKYSYSKIIELIKKREISCEELMNYTFDHIENHESILQSYISLKYRNEVINEAKESDKRWKNGTPKSDIDGIPIAIKDNIHCIGLNTTCASRILGSYHPPFDAHVSQNIKNAGGIIIGKTNMDEFAMGSTSETSAFKKTKNPYDITRVPGGSSGGSAASVASGMALLSLGSDTGGSIRQPASFCGIVGLKPTYGLVSRFGLVAYASSLDQIGPMSKDVYGCATLLNIIAGNDKKDSTSLDVPKEDYTKNLNKDIKGLKVAIIPELLKEGISPGVQEQFLNSIKILEKLGAKIEEVPFSLLKYVVSTYYFIATAEASSNLARYDGVKYGFRSPKQSNYEEMIFSTRSYGFGKEVKKRILLGNFVLSSGYYDEYYRKAQKIRAMIMNELKSILSKFDIIATPTTPDIAFKFGESETDPLKIYLADITTVLPNLSALPAISIPCGKVDSMPVGLQFIGKALSEAKLLQIAYNFEKEIKLDLVPDLTSIKNIEIEDIKEQKEIELDLTSVTYSKETIKKISDSYMNRSSNLSERTLLNQLKDKIGQKVKVAGWIHKINSLGGIEFYVLRDRNGLTQLTIEENILNRDLSNEKIVAETVIEVEGIVTKEERSPYNGIEIKVEKIKILGHSHSDIPINVSANYNSLNLPTILDNRPISIRNLKILKIFKIQSEILRLFSEFLRKNEFVEIKTPKIISTGTEGGTNIFEIKYFDRIAYLAQSPQFYKQTMVGSGFERVFEIGPVFRAEIHNTIRHLNEYTSLDFEIGFIKDEQDVIDIQENLLKFTFSEIKRLYGDEIKDEFGVDIIIPDKIPRIHFLEAIEIAAKYGLKDMDGDISPEGERVICEYFLKEKNSPLVYIIGYPIKKRPMYTMPDERLPGYTRSFDLLFNGLEITTGGQRINEYEQLKANIIAFGGNPALFKSYLDIFKYGMPPHGGLGMGLERITMKLLGLNNVREATLFPRDINRLAP